MMLAAANRVGAQCTGGAPQCQILVTMHDGYGDGWNEGQLYVYQGSTLRGTVTLSSGSNGESTVLVCSDSITFVWSQGIYDDEISFVVTGESGDTLLTVDDASVFADGDTIAMIEHQCPSCPRPLGLQLVTRSHDQLQLAWNGTASGSWLVEYGVRGFTPGSGTSYTVTTPTITLTGLDSATHYDVYVTAVCGSESSQPVFGSYVTTCGTDTCSIRFELQDSYGDGWNGGSGVWVVQNGDTVAFVTCSSGHHSTVLVPLCSDSVTLVWKSGSWDSENSFELYNSGNGLMLIMSSGGDYYDGDIIGTVMNDCSVCHAPSIVRVTASDTASLTIAWPSTGAPTYALYISDGISEVQYTTPDTFYTFTSLQPMTTYMVGVAGVCSAGDTSNYYVQQVTTPPAWTPIIYVSTTGDDTDNGSSWSHALASINAASDLSQLYYTRYGSVPEMWVAQGSYYAEATLLPGQHVYGGLVGNEPANYDMSLRDLQAHATTVSGGTIVYQPNDATSSTEAWWDGFTLTGATDRVAVLRDYGSLRNCTITNNSTSWLLMSFWGTNNNPDSTASLLNCVITDNSSSYGSNLMQMLHSRAENCLFARNNSNYATVAMFDGGVLSHCDVVNNTTNNSAAVSGGSYVTAEDSRVINSILWGNTTGSNGNASAQLTGLLVANHSAIQGDYSGTGNINLSYENEGTDNTANYPVFVSPLTDYHLNSGSACINTASSTLFIATDLDGNARPYGSTNDIGCYEYQGVDVCGPITFAQIDEVTSYSARVTWLAPHAGYIVYYMPENGTTWDSLSVDAETTGVYDSLIASRTCSVRLTGLSGLTAYTVRLRGVCDNGISDDYTLTFQTLCPDVVGYITVGDTMSSTTYQGSQIPTNTYYNYGATQQIYLASELGEATTIGQLDFFYTFGSSITRRLKIYLGHTTMNAFSSSSDVIPESQLTLVYSGEYTFSNTPRMNSIQLQTPFAYNGTDNLVVAVIDSTGSWQSSGDKFMTFSAPNRSLYYSRDGSPVNFSNVTFNMGSYCNVLHLPGECDVTACPTPNYSVTAGVTTAEIDWVVSGTARMEYRATDETDFITVSLTTNPTTLTGLQPYKEYEVRMHNICGAGDTSRWISHTFTTLPPNVQRLYVKSDATGDGSGTSWANAMTDIDHALQLADACYSVYGTLCDIWVAEGTYYGDTTRNYAFGMVPGVRLYGGLQGNEPENYDLNQRDLAAHPTILDGAGARQVVNHNTSIYRQRNAVIDGVTIQNGYTSSNGGGVYGYRLDLRRSVIRYCVSNGNYGAGAYISNGSLNNCLIYGNSGSYYGGGVYAYYSNINHCDIVENSSSYYGGLYYTYGDTLSNSIVWGNRRNNGYDDQVYIYANSISHFATDCALDGDSTILHLAHANEGTDDSLYVRFVSPVDHDYRLKPTSACVDMGVTSAASIDLGGSTRLYGTAPDLGCYEYHGEQYCIRPTLLTVSDVNGFAALASWQCDLDTVILEYLLATDTANANPEWTTLMVVGQQHLLMPLVSDTTYLVRTKAVCGSGYSPYSDIVEFTTTCGAGVSEITLGDSNSYGTSLLPLNAYYSYSYTQTLIDADELGNQPFTIGALYWQYTHSSPSTRSIQIYLGETDLSVLTSSNAVPASALTCVYTGSVTFNNTVTWTAIPLQQAFNYSGTHNLVVAVIDNTGSWSSPSNRFATHQTDEVKSIYLYRDGSPYSVSESYSFSTTNQRANMRIPSSCVETSCPTPNLIKVAVTPTTATYRTVTMGPMQMQYRAEGSDNYIDLMPADTVTISGLLQNTNYELRVRTICGVGDTSVWKTAVFTTTVQPLERLYVTAEGAGLHNGSSWNNATADLNWAVSTANVIHNTFNLRPQVWVAEGTYYGNTTAANAFTMLAGVDVYGGFEGNEPATFDLTTRNNETHPTVLDGQGVRRVLYQPTQLSNDSITWDGFTITGGQAGNNDGGGAYLQQGGILANSTVTHCRAHYGGGVYSYYGTLRNCTISNDSANTGGGIYNYYGNVRHCTITGNQANNYGGLYQSSGVTSNSLIANNTAQYYGGVYMYGGSMYNCDIVANLTTSSTSLNYASYTNFYNTLFWGNRSSSSSATRLQLSVSSSSSFNHSAFETQMPETGNTNECIILSSSNSGALTSPMFVQPAYGVGMDHADGCNWMLQEGSILIDRGSTDSTIYTNPNYGPATDLAGYARLQSNGSDIGCYESPYNGINMPTYPDSIVYVTSTGAGQQDGSSWSNALANINDAVIYSIMNGHLPIWVAEGTYYGDTTAAGAFFMMDGVNMYGSFVGNEPPTYDLSLRDVEAHPTILDAQHTGRVINQASNFNILTVVDGFVLQNGLVTNQPGAGVTLRHNGRLRNCTVQNNITIVTNSNSSYGIGVYITNTNNYDTVLDHCVVQGNGYQNLRPNGYTAYVYGGGIYIGTNAVVANCEVYGNSSYYGGGIYSSNGQIYNTIVAGNQARSYAGTYLSYGNMYNSVVANNTSTYNYGGVYNYSSSNIYNSIIWSNKVNYLADNVGGAPYMYNCAVEGGYADGTNIIDLAATNDGTSGTDNYVRFIDPNQHNYRLHPASHCLDYGDSSYSHLATDLDGNPRIMGGNIDLGAYECENSTTCPSPLNLRSLAITGTSATFAWSPQGSENQWLFAIQGGDGTLDSNITLSDTTVTVTGLSLNRSYTCYVRANCGGEYSIHSPQLTITTLCDSTTLTPLSAFTTFLPADSALIYDQQADFSWSALPEATSYDFYIWKGDVEPTTPSVTGVTATTLNNYPLPNYERGAYYHWKVVAWNECINRTSPTHVLRVNPLPDLHVSQVTCSSPVANQPMTVTWTVQNDGEGTTPAGTTWTDYIWLSGVDGVGGGFWYGVDEVLLAQVPNLTSLGAGDSYTNSVTVTIPEDYIGGYYLFVMTDLYAVRDLNYYAAGLSGPPDPYTPSATGNPYPYLAGTMRGSQTVSETNDADNFFYKVLNILPPPSPDLRVTHVSHPINAFSNSDITVGWTIANQGSSTATGGWYDDIYIQMGSELNMAEAHRLARVKHNGGLATDSSYQASATVHLPISYSGTYNIFVVTDMLDSVYESIYESNNTTVSQQTIDIVMSPLSDLTVTSVNMPANISPRCTYPVSWTVANIGTAATEKAQWHDALYLSSTPTYSTSTSTFLKHVEHNGVIGIDSSYTRTENITIPAILSGSYYLIVRTDYRDSIFEYLNENNNTGVSTQPAQVLLPDLVVGNVTMENSVAVGDTLHIQAYIKNIGQGTAYNQITVSFNAGGQSANKGVQCELAPGDSVMVTCLLKQPCVNTTQGELTIQADVNNSIYEGSATSNNAKTIAYTVRRADLTANAISYAATSWSGTSMPVVIALSNIGTVAVNDTVGMTMYVSTSSITYTANAANRVMESREWMHLPADSSIVVIRNVTLPNGIEGDYYLHLVIDPTNRICEQNETNNVTHGSTSTHVNLSPYPDLIVRNLVTDDTLSVGQTVPFNFNLINQGIAAAQGSLTTKVFMSLGATYNSAPLIEVATLQQTVNIGVGDTMACIATGMIPTNVNAGFYYFYAVTDYSNAFYEHTGENNNTVRSALTFVKLYPLDLMIDSISGPATVDWGQQVTYTVIVTNNSNVTTSAARWAERLYLTQDGAISTNMPYLEQNHTTALQPGESYQVNFEVTIPYGSPSTLYLVGICDYNRNNPDINLVNNQFTKTITVNSVPTPDLHISDVEVIGDIVSGQPFQLAYTVTNVSETPVAQQHWVDRVSMSYTPTLSSSAQQLLLKPQERALPSGSSYRDTMEVTIPLPNQGSRYLVVQANAQLNFYETIQDNNLTALPVTITLPPPGDLVVSRIATPDTVVSGSRSTLHWTVTNIGANDITGRGLGSLLYLSGDDQFDANDRLLGRTDVGQINLAPGDSLMQQLSTRIYGVAEGNYYIIAKTDVRNAFYEDNENNNTTVSTLPLYVKVRELLFNTPLTDTLYNGEPNDYKLNVGTHRNETVRLHVESNDSLHGAVNMIYVSHNTVGDNLNYNLSTLGQYTANPELYIPSTRAGYYGVSLYGSLPANTMQVVTVTADILPFELRSINPTEGGNNGNVTVEMTGSRFRPDMKVWMLHQGDTLFADTLIYSSYYQAFARFNLKGADTGMYSMGVLNYCEGEAMLTDVFHVTEESPDGLGYHLVFPNSPRPNRTISMMLEYGNMGNTDIQGAVLEVQSVGGTYIALTPEGLSEQGTVLRIPLSIEGEPEGLLRPGSYGTVTIYGFTAGSLVFAIKEVQ